MNIKLTLVLALIFFPTLSFAKTIYLDCYIKNDDGTKKVFSVTVDKDNRKITHVRKNGSAFNAEGFFTKDTISYKKDFNFSPMLLTFTYSIDRSSLKVQEAETTGPDATIAPEIAIQMPPETTTKNGVCKIAKVKKQQI